MIAEQMAMATVWMVCIGSAAGGALGIIAYLALVSCVRKRERRIEGLRK